MVRRLSIGVSLRLALAALTAVLAVVAAAGVARLYTARQSYEDTLARASSLSVAAANLSAAGIVEQEVLRDAPGRRGAAARRQAAAGYRIAAGEALAFAAGDPPSAALVSRQIALEDRGRALARAGRLELATAASGPLAQTRLVTAAIQQRQLVREQQARSHAGLESRRALLFVAIAGLLALLGAFALVARLVNAMRSPLKALVEATRAMAGGDLDRRVQPAGPRELRDLGETYNTMGEVISSAQRRIEDERRRLAVTIESLGDGLIVTEPDAVTIAAMNPRARELLPELHTGELLLPGEGPLPPLAEALARETTLEHRGRTLAITAAMLETESDGVVWTVRDMSERARLEHAKSDFVATASHELRSPLTSIKGFVELLERSAGNMTDRQREFIDIILRSTDRLVELVGDLLDVARIEADRVEIELRPVDVGEAIYEVTELMSQRIAEKRQTLEVHVSPALAPAMADPARVRQMVANLLTNAHLYTPEGGKLVVSAAPDRASVEISVVDSGRGMSEEEQARIFERFYRGSEGGASGPGTGLGLSIVRSLVELHHGEIAVRSAPGEGSTFTIRLPVAVSDGDGRRTYEAIRGRRVLVLDDEPELAELINGQLAALDVETTVMTDGEAALAELRRGGYDAMTLDILMPGMDGFEILRRIREDPSTRGLPIVFVSVYSGRRELAGEWVVPKPIDADRLREVLAAAVSSTRSRVLVVARDELRDELEPSLAALGIEFEWVSSGAAAARVCGERRFELAMVDVGLRNPRAVLQALDLRGRRVSRAVVLFSDANGDSPDGVAGLGLEVVPVGDAAGALLSAIRGAAGARG